MIIIIIIIIIFCLSLQKLMEEIPLGQSIPRRRK